MAGKRLKSPEHLSVRESPRQICFIGQSKAQGQTGLACESMLFHAVAGQLALSLA